MSWLSPTPSGLVAGRDEPTLRLLAVASGCAVEVISTGMTGQGCAGNFTLSPADG